MGNIAMQCRNISMHKLLRAIKTVTRRRSCSVQLTRKIELFEMLIFFDRFFSAVDPLINLFCGQCASKGNIEAGVAFLTLHYAPENLYMHE